MREFGLKNVLFFYQNDSCKNLENFSLMKLLKEPSREKALLTLHVLTEMHFLLQKNLRNIMHGRVKMYVMR